MRHLFAALTVGLVAGLLALAACPNSESSAEQGICPTPWGIGPDGTQGVCGLEELCVPMQYVSCASNDCCHAFCALGCGIGVAQVELTPDEIPDGGAPGCGCDGATIKDAGVCACTDAGSPCYFTSCLCVCSD